MTSQQEAGTTRSRMNRVNGLTQGLTRRSSSKAEPEPEPVNPLLGHAIIDKIYDDKKKKEWGDWAEVEFTKCKNARAPFERQWYLNLAFVNGRQYVVPARVAGNNFSLVTPKSPPWRVKMVVNKVRTANITKAAKLNANKPIPTVIPATGEDQDFNAARIAEHLLKSEFGTASFNTAYRSWIWWGVTCGVSFLKQYWDPTTPDDTLMNPAKPKMGADGKPLMGMDGKPIMEPQTPVMGKIVTERITPFHIYVPDLLSESLEEQPYIIHAMTQSPEWVKSRFNVDVKPEVRAASTFMEAATVIAKNSEQHLDSVVVKEIWIKPGGHKDFPQGGVLTIAQGKVLQCKDKWPWPFKEYPFYKFEDLYTGGFYPDSMIVDLIPLQKEYNRTRSQMVEIKNTMGKPKLLVQQGSVSPRQISSEPGQAIIYKAGFEKPFELRGAEIPQTMPVELDRLNADFDDISGQHEITRGNTPAQVTSGTAINFLQEQDDTKLNYPVNSIEAAMELLGKHYLKFVSTYWTEERLIRISGKDDRFEALQWKGSDLRGNTDVKVQAGSALPVSKAAKRAFLTEQMQNGFLDPIIGMEMMELGGIERALDELLVDKRQAQRENLKMSTLTPEDLEEYHTNEMAIAAAEKRNPEPFIKVNSWDDHEQHIKFHNNFRKTQDFEILHPAIKQEFELHVQTHQMALVGEQVGDLGSVQNDPNAPVMDPESGTLMPNPLQEELPLDDEPPVGNPEELDALAKMMDIKNKQEQHELNTHVTASKLKLAQEAAKQKKSEGGKGAAR